MYFAKKSCAAVVACAGLASAQFMNPSHGSVVEVGQKIDIKWNQAGLQAPLSISLIPGGTIIEESIIIQKVAVNIGNVGVISWTADESITAIETFSMVIIDAHKTIVVSEPFIINHLHKKPHYKHGKYGHVTTVTVTEKEGHYMTKTETTTVETDMPVMTEEPKVYTSGDYLKYLPGEAQTQPDYYQHLTPLPGGDYMKTTEENKYYKTSEEKMYDTTSTMEQHKYTTEEMKYETSTTEEKMYETSTSTSEEYKYTPPAEYTSEKKYETSTTEEKMYETSTSTSEEYKYTPPAEYTSEKKYETSTTEVKYTPPYMQTYSAPPPPPPPPPPPETSSCDTSTTEVKYMPPAMNTYVPPPPPPPPADTYTPPEMKTYAPPPPPPAYTYTPPEMKTYAPPPPPPAYTYTPPAQTYTPPPMETYTPPPMDTYTPPPPPPDTYTPPPPPPETSVESIYTPSEVPTTFETSIPVVTPPAITGNATVPGNGTFPITALGIKNVPSGWIVGVSVLLGLMI